MDDLASRLKEVMSEMGFKTSSDLASFCDVSEGLVSQWFAGTTKLGPKPLKAFGRTHFSLDWLTDGKLPKYRRREADSKDSSTRRAADFGLRSADEASEEVGSIEYWDAKGSCGGGFLNLEQLPKGHLVKEMTFFKKYGLRPESAFAIYADGDSMADFIVDGDIVIFDRTKTEPRSGKIFAIEHPDGLRIKVLRRGIDGAWILESRNPDKRAFPDERIPPD